MKGLSRDKYVFNRATLKYEKAQESFKSKLFKFFGLVVIVVVCSFLLNRVYTNLFPTVQYQTLEVELNEMRAKYDDMNGMVDLMSTVLENIQDRDANVHRMVFGLEPIDSNIWQGGIGGHELYNQYDGFENKDLIKTTTQRLDRLSRQMSLQSKSLDEIEKFAADKEKYLNAIPSIKPVREDKLKRKIKYLSGFGMRMHPVHKILKMHAGLDFTAPIGTDVQATGNGVIKKVENIRTGYGKNIIIDHGYGYQTLYAHLSDISVKKGQKVTKGQVIGKLGNTGTSTAPHLHYEVRVNGKAVNPVNYVMDGLSPEEYSELVRKATEGKKSLD